MRIVKTILFSSEDTPNRLGLRIVGFSILLFVHDVVLDEPAPVCQFTNAAKGSQYGSVKEMSKVLTKLSIGFNC